MPYWLLESVDPDGFLRSRIVYNLSKPTHKDCVDWLAIPPGQFNLKITKISEDDGYELFN